MSHFFGFLNWCCGADGLLKGDDAPEDSSAVRPSASAETEPGAPGGATIASSDDARVALTRLYADLSYLNKRIAVVKDAIEVMMDLMDTPAERGWPGGART